EMAGEIGKLVGQHFRYRGVDLDAADAAGAEHQRGQNVTAAADADHGDVGRLLHQIGRVDDVVLQISELAEIAVEPGDRRSRIGIDVEIMLVDRTNRFVGEAPAE